jgi:integrase
MTMIDLDDYFSSDTIKQDLEDAAQDELNFLLESTGGKASSASNSLSVKLNTYPQGNFQISEYSLYNEEEWLLEKTKGQTPIKIYFHEADYEFNELKRALLYYTIPDFCAFGAIKSYSTTKSYTTQFNTFIEYIFKYNHLKASDPSDISCITPAMLNEALDRAKDNQDAARHYHSLFCMIRLWFSLSTQEMIPEQLRININYSRVDNKTRHKDVVKHFQGTSSTWIPFSENDLSKLINYSLFWLEKALPVLIEVRDYLGHLTLVKTKGSPYSTKGADQKFEQTANVEIEGVCVLKTSLSKLKPQEKNGFKTHQYNWKSGYAVALDHIRNSLFIMIGIVLGLRKREMTQLTLDDIYKDDGGEYWINITRFKTTSDPNYHGESEVMPVPHFIGECVDFYKHLKSISDFKKQNYLFQSNKSRKRVNNFTSGNIRIVIDEIRKFTGVERPHCHRFRKTTAEILINRSEKNIDLIRMLFGHESYEMTLKYIARNPFMVRAVAEAIEVHFTEDFHEVVKNIRDDSYSGEPAERIANAMLQAPEKFQGKQLKLQLMNYISHLLSSGEMLFIHRTAIGIYCINNEEITLNNLPPCLAEQKYLSRPLLPDTNNCQLECKHCAVIDKAKQAISGNIEFYNSILEATDGISAKARTVYQRKLSAAEKHLKNLDSNKLKIKESIGVKVLSI